MWIFNSQKRQDKISSKENLEFRIRNIKICIWNESTIMYKNNSFSRIFSSTCRVENHEIFHFLKLRQKYTSLFRIEIKVSLLFQVIMRFSWTEIKIALTSEYLKSNFHPISFFARYYRNISSWAIQTRYIQNMIFTCVSSAFTSS